MLLSAMGVKFSTVVQKINYPIHNGLPNDAHGKFIFVGSIPESCYDVNRNGGHGGSKLYDSEHEAILAAIAGGAEYIHGADCRKIDIALYKMENKNVT